MTRIAAHICIAHVSCFLSRLSSLYAALLANACLSARMLRFWSFFLFQAAVADTLSRKKIVRKTPHSVATCIVGLHKCKQTPIVQFCANRVMVVTLIRRAWAYNIASVWLPYTNMGNTIFKGANQKVGFIIFISTPHSACSCKNYGLKCFPELQTLDYFNYLNLFFSTSYRAH